MRARQGTGLLIRVIAAVVGLSLVLAVPHSSAALSLHHRQSASQQVGAKIRLGYTYVNGHQHDVSLHLVRGAWRSCPAEVCGLLATPRHPENWNAKVTPKLVAGEHAVRDLSSRYYTFNGSSTASKTLLWDGHPLRLHGYGRYADGELGSAWLYCRRN